MISQQNLEEKQRFLKEKQIIQEQTRRTIDEEVQALHTRKNEAKVQSLELDHALLEIDRQRVIDESLLREERRKLEESEGKNNLKLQEIREKWKQQEKQRDQQEFNELTKRNILKEAQKEANYKNFWKSVAENQFLLYREHKNRYFEPEVAKLQSLEEKILRDMEAEKQRREAKEKEQLNSRKQEFLSYSLANLELMEKKRRLEEEKSRMNQDILHNIQQEGKSVYQNRNYNEFDKWVREEKIKSQNSYRQELDHYSIKKRAEKTMEVINRNRMTRNEKNLNIRDLQAFKVNDGGLYSKMMPGWSPQIGNIGKKQIEDLFSKVNNEVTENPNSSNNPANSEKKPIGYNEIRTGFNHSVPKSREVIKRNLGVFGTQQEIEKKSVSSHEDHREGAPKSHKRESSLNYGHDPINNPTPFNIQNPYLRREYLKYLGKN